MTTPPQRITPDWRADFELARITRPLIHVCMKCKRQLEAGTNRPMGEPLPLAPGQSHGICTEHLREWGRELGLPESAIQRLEESARLPEIPVLEPVEVMPVKMGEL